MYTTAQKFIYFFYSVKVIMDNYNYNGKIFLFKINYLKFLIKDIRKPSTVSNIDDNIKCFLSTKSAYEKISEGSCDTEDWSNGVMLKNSALPFT